MTRNNLSDQLNWLLKNIAISKPPAQVFPTNNESSSFRFSSQSQPLDVYTASQSFSGSFTTLEERPKPRSRESATSTSNGQAKRERDQRDFDVVILEEEEDDKMGGRLMSSSKQRKSLLVSQQGQLLTPSATGDGPSRQRLNQPAVGAATPKPIKSKRKVSPPRTASRRPASSNRSPTFAGFDDDELDYMDLTEALTNSVESVQYGENIKLWNEKDASWGFSSPKSNKRKSMEISKDDSNRDTSFPDVYEILGTEAPAPTPGSRSARKPASTSTISKLRLTKTPNSARAGSPKMSSDRSSSPSRQIASQRPQSFTNQTSQDDRASSSTPESRKKAKTNFAPASPSFSETGSLVQKSSRAMAHQQNEFFIPDSDDELEMSPNRTSSHGPALSADPTKSHQKSTQMLEPRELAAVRALSETQGSSGLHSPIGFVGPTDPPIPSSQTPKVLSYLTAHPSAPARYCEHIDNLIYQNKRDFERSMAARLSREKRNEIKAEGKKLTQQQIALREMCDPIEAYKLLLDTRETLAQQIAQSYANGLDTDQDETRLDELTDEVQEKEQELLIALSATGLDEIILMANANAEASDPSHEDVVFGTQAGHVGAVDMSRGSLDPPFTILPGTQVVHQTQLPEAPQSHLWNEPISKQKLSSRGGVLSQEDQTLLSEPFPRDSLPPLKAPVRGKTNAADRNLDAEDDLFSDIDDIEMQLFPNPPKKPIETRKPSPKSRLHRADPEFGDLSNDAEMLAFAQTFEDHQSLPGFDAPRDPRSAFTEMSGNGVPAAPKSKPASVKKHVPAAQTRTKIPPELMKHPWSKDVQRILKDRFRMSGFRHNQLEAINATLAAEDAFVLMPTGGGKSLCYQLPAIIKSGKTRGVTIVISPLLSLMQDQVDHMKALGIQAVAFNSECSAEYKKQVLSMFDTPKPEHYVELLYVTPEMVNKSAQFVNAMQALYRNRKLARLVIDEAHCVSQWGHDFRPDYTSIGQVRTRFPEVPVMALTATATQNVIVDIKHNLGMINCQVFSQSFNRPNLYYEVRPKTKNDIATNEIAELIKARYPNVTGIVYTISRKQAEEVAQKLSHAHIRARHYHAGISPQEKVEVQTAWQKGQVKVVVATIAFGMGIDKPDVRFVVHHGIPKSLEGYYQETGRAGRDGASSDCILFYGKADIRVLKKLIADGEGSKEQKERQMVMLNRVTAFCDNQSDCRRTEVLRYFGEDFDPSECKKMCDNCRAGLVFEQQDFSECAIAAIKVVQLQARLTPNQCADILLGKKYPDRQAQCADEYFGAIQGMKKHEVVRVIDRLSAEKGFYEENVVGNHGMAIQYLKIGPAARLFLNGQRQLMLNIQVQDDSASASTSKKTKTTKKTSKKFKESSASNLQSTYVSSPVDRRRQREATPDDESHLPTTHNGYAHDGFVVSDNEEDDEEEDRDGGAFDPLPRHRPAKPASKPSSQKRSRVQPTASRRRLQDLPELHQDIINGFVLEAQEVEEGIRNKKELRKPLFTVANFEDMAMNWTVTLDSMRALPDIDPDKVREHGAKLLPILKRHQEMFREIMGGDGTEETEINGQGSQEVVDLISSDIDMDDDDAGGEDSHYFSAKEKAEVQAFHERLERLSSQRGTSSRSRSRSSSTLSRGSKRFSGKKWSKKASSTSGGAGGVSKRKANVSSKRTTGGCSSAAGPSSASRASFANASGSGSASASGSRSQYFKKESKGKKSGTIGMMPM